MKISILLAASFVFLAKLEAIKSSTVIRAAAKSFETRPLDYSSAGFWKTRSEWKGYWVKDWVVKKIYVPIWKRVWGPAQVKEWVPTGVAKPPPGLKPHGTIH